MQATVQLAKESETAWLDAEILLAAVLGTTRTRLLTWPEQTLSQRELFEFHALIAHRAQGIPIAYLTGHQEFWSLPLQVTPSTLIPRPETELLVELAMARIPKHDVVTVADMGTGSGAIALAIARERPHCQVVATDRSTSALSVARDNAEALRIGNVRFVAGDWFEPLLEQRFDIIVSNPPYIAASDPHLERGDLRFEPRTALAAGNDGLGDLRTIAREAHQYLLPQGWLLLEHGYNQNESVTKLLVGHGYTNIETAHDLAGIPRVVAAQNQ